MTIFFETLLLFICLSSLAFHQFSRIIWTPLAGIFLLIFTVFSHVPWLILLIGWAIYLAVAIVFNVSEFRLRLISQPTLKFLRKALPPMTETERVALETGDIWWDAELFQGKPNWQQLLDYRKPTLSKVEEDFINNEVETLCSMLDDWQITQDNDLPKAAWDFIKQNKFFGMVIPKQYGGHEFSALAHSTIVTKIATRSISAAVTVMVPNSLGPAELLMHYGTEEQKNHYLPRLAVGQEIPCFGLTGPEAGSDATAMPDRGVVCKGKHEGKEIIGIRLNFDKRYITLAPVATLLGVGFKLYDPDHLLGDRTDIGITLCLLPADHPGVEIGKRHKPLNLAFMNGPMRGKDVFIPLDWIIGGQKMAGEGWRMFVECLTVGRSISLPALSIATAKLCYRATGAYAALRKQFRMPIGHLEGVQECLARIAGHAYLLTATGAMTADAIGQGVRPAVISAIAKYNMTELNRSIFLDAMDIHAGKAIQLGPNNYLGSHYLSLPVSITVEGANLLTRNLIIFGQGAIRCHPFVRDEMLVAQQKDEQAALAAFDVLLLNHIGYALRNVIRTFAYGLSGARLAVSPIKGPTAQYYRQLTRMSAALAFVSDIAMMILGGDLKRKERLSARLGDVLSQLYMGSAVLKYYQDNGSHEDDLSCVHWVMQESLYRIQIAFDEFLKNFPQKQLAWFVRFMVFPYGRRFSAPSDQLSHQIAQQMLMPSAFRDRLTKYCYVDKNSKDALAQLEEAFNLLPAVMPLEKKIREAIKEGVLSKTMNFDERMAAAVRAKILTQAEVNQLNHLEKLRAQVIAVDEFPVAKASAIKKTA